MSKNLPLVAIVGRPNVGKSSLFNRLLGERKAIVAEEAGTTRDRVQGITEWNGRAFWLVDTAGIDRAEDEIESSMQAQVGTAIEQADLVVVVVDGSTIMHDQDQAAIKSVQKAKKPMLVAINKSDRAKQPLEKNKLRGAVHVSVSAIHGNGSGDLLDMIVSNLPEGKQKAKSNHITIALLGRPNVGKSSLLNQLSGEERAIVAAEAGTTRDVTHIDILVNKQSYRLLDTAGIRRSGKRTRGIEKFSAIRTINAINEADVCILLTDASEPATSQDQRIAGMIKDAGKPLIMAVNKWDLTERDDDTKRILEHSYIRQFPYIWWAPLIFISAKSGHNVRKLLPMAKKAYKNWLQEIQTAKLNGVMEAAIAAHPPAGLKNRHPKLRYITQTANRPPTFTIFGSGLDFLHWSYKRFFETKLREEFDFSGTPIQLRFSSRAPRKEQEVGIKK